MCNGEEEYNKQVKKSKNMTELKNAIVNGSFPSRKKYKYHNSSSDEQICSFF